MRRYLLTILALAATFVLATAAPAFAHGDRHHDGGGWHNDQTAEDTHVSGDTGEMTPVSTPTNEVPCPDMPTCKCKPTTTTEVTTTTVPETTTTVPETTTSTTTPVHHQPPTTSTSTTQAPPTTQLIPPVTATMPPKQTTTTTPTGTLPHTGGRTDLAGFGLLALVVGGSLAFRRRRAWNH